MAATGERHLLTRWIFLRALALVWLVAFASLAVQVNGLYGSHGIEPVARLLAHVRDLSVADRLFRAPTLLWGLGASDVVLRGLCGVGIVLALLLGIGLAPGPICLALWATYLSFVTVGSPFLDFQWDLLMLEVGLCACVLAPWRLWAGGVLAERRPSSVAIWLLRFVLFKLVFMSGLVKLASGDPTWRNLTALQYHYWTTCLPTWLGWWVQQMPAQVHRASAAALFALELGAPFLVLGPRRARVVGLFLMLALQLGIAATGNYGFFNLLALLLCVVVLDDRDWERLRRWFARVRAMRASDSAGGALPLDASGSEPRAERVGHVAAAGPRARILPRDAPAWIVATLVVSASLFHMQGRFFGYDSLPAPALQFLGTIEPFRSANPYGLFATMTTRRPEILVEGSRDGETWTAYEFRWKPGDPNRRPEFVAPHMPRLDWQMWFAALGSWERDPWLESFLSRLLEGSTPALKLLAADPFEGRPPQFVRATLWDYRFTDPATLRATGAWWMRTELGPYGPVMQRRTTGDVLRPEPPATAPQEDGTTRR